MKLAPTVTLDDCGHPVPIVFSAQQADEYAHDFPNAAWLFLCISLIDGRARLCTTVAACEIFFEGAPRD
jgi:hypothetical protein